MEDKYTKLRLLFATSLIACPYGMSMYFGNIISYVYSFRYIVAKHDNKNSDLDLSWLFGIYVTSINVGILIVGPVHRTIGLRFTMALGIILYSFGLTFTYFTVQYSVWTMALTLGFIAGNGNGIVSSVVLLYIAGWFEQKVGTAAATAGAFSGIGSNAMNQIITALINPDNLSPDIIKGQISYFTQSPIIDSVPIVFVVIGAITAALQIFGFCFLKQPPCQASKATHEKSISLFPTSLNGNLNCDAESRGSGGPMDNEESPFAKKETDLGPIQVLKSESFYIVFFSMFAMAFSQLLISTYYKIFGLLWIVNDTFLANIGSSSSILTIFSRILCGVMADRFGAKNTIIFHLAINSSFQAVWYFTARSNRWWYLVWTNCLLAIQNNLYVLYPVAIVQIFGKRCCITNLFLINLASIMAMFTLPPFMDGVIHSIGWFWLFYISACISLCSLLACVIRL